MLSPILDACASTVQLARHIRSGDFSAREVVEAHVRRIEAVNPGLNAVVLPLFERALAEADAADARRARGEGLGVLHGVPVTIKENFDVAGTPTTAGVVARRSHVALQDAAAVARLRDAGAIVVGKTNLAQLMLFVESDNPVFGRTNNPWNRERSPGGSSGGEGAIVAAGGSAIGLGNDIGGSIRNPAHCCGICGIMPTPGRVPYEGAFDPNNREDGIKSVAGPLARSVDDLALALRVLAADAIEPRTVEMQQLRVGFYVHNGIFAASPALRRAVNEAQAALAALGVAVEAFEPPRPSEAFRIYLAMLGSDGAALQGDALRGSKRDPRVNMLIGLTRFPNVLRPAAASIASALGQRRTATAIQALKRRSPGERNLVAEMRANYQRELLSALDARRLDAIVCPPFALPAVTHGATANLLDALSYTALFNLVGWPAGVVAATCVRQAEESDRPKSADIEEVTARKVERGSAGLPIGVQIAARPFREDVVLALMGGLEEYFRGASDYPKTPIDPR